MIDSSFPAALKLDRITLVSKKISKNSKENYRLLSILPNISKIYERYIYIKCLITLVTFTLSFSVGFAKASVRNTVCR